MKKIAFVALAIDCSQATIIVIDCLFRTLQTLKKLPKIKYINNRVLLHNLPYIKKFNNGKKL
jgi:hypothetical protein